jgi:uncharacterized damage-inducible protein DinB
MFTLDGIRKFHAWTHASLSLLLNHLSTLPSEACAREVPSFGFNTIQKQVIHIFNCEGLWISTLQGFAYVDRDPRDFASVADATVFQQEISSRTTAYLSTANDEQLNTEMQLNFPDGDHAVRTPALILHHVFTHAFHHKGQIVAMCRALGYPAPDTDLNQFQ